MNKLNKIENQFDSKKNQIINIDNYFNDNLSFDFRNKSNIKRKSQKKDITDNSNLINNIERCINKINKNSNSFSEKINGSKGKNIFY